MHTFYKAPYFFICHQWFLWRMFNQFWIFLNSFVFQVGDNYLDKVPPRIKLNYKILQMLPTKKEVTAHCKIHPILSPINEVIYLQMDTKFIKETKPPHHEQGQKYSRLRYPLQKFSLFLKFNHFLWVCWFFGKNLPNFVSPARVENP